MTSNFQSLLCFDNTHTPVYSISNIALNSYYDSGYDYRTTITSYTLQSPMFNFYVLYNIIRTYVL